MEEINDCIFCKIAKGEIPSEKIYDDDNFFAILDNSPKAEGHTLIISKNHYKNILDVPSSLGGDMLDVVKKIGLKLIRDKKVEGFNVCVNMGGVAGQTVHHFHAHIIPRRQGDGLKGIV